MGVEGEPCTTPLHAEAYICMDRVPVTSVNTGRIEPHAFDLD